jgi:peptidyl-prolyl cis-trans isomerase B (cyclophilin B)
VVNNKQQREAARRHLQRQLQQRQDRERRRKKATQLVAAIVGLAVVAAAIIVTLVVTGGGDSGKQAGASKTCTYTPGGTASKTVNPPASSAPSTGTDEATLTTNNGVITATLDRAAAPCTVASFVSLAKQHYFDATTCHRLVNSGILVLQCGDPSGTGSGGPGYSFADELTGSEKYTRGVLAMANSGANTNGSQFFIVYGDSSGLGASYTVFGSVSTAGLAVVDKIAAAGVTGGGTDGAPALETVILTATIAEGTKAPADSSGADVVATPTPSAT